MEVCPKGQLLLFLSCLPEKPLHWEVLFSMDMSRREIRMFQELIGLGVMSEIIPGLLYQGGAIAAYFEKMEDGKLKAIVNLESLPDPHYKDLRFQLMWAIVDGPINFTKEELDLVANFVVSQLRMGNPTLVHCSAGINRSGLVNARALMLFKGCTADEAINIIRTARPWALSNKYFVELLRSY
jgi:protein-tyrosine phosphatase